MGIVQQMRARDIQCLEWISGFSNLILFHPTRMLSSTPRKNGPLPVKSLEKYCIDDIMCNVPACALTNPHPVSTGRCRIWRRKMPTVEIQNNTMNLALISLQYFTNACRTSDLQFWLCSNAVKNKREICCVRERKKANSKS